MSKILLALCLALAAGSLALNDAPPVSAQDCERAIPGNTQSPCKMLDYLDGIQPPTFTVEQTTDSRGTDTCQGYLEFSSTSPLRSHTSIIIAGASTHSEITGSRDWGVAGNWYLIGSDSRKWYPAEPAYLMGEDKVRTKRGPLIYLHSPVGEPPETQPFLRVAAKFGDGGPGTYVVVSDMFPRPEEVEDYQLMMNQCLAGIASQLEQEAAVETARQRAEADRVAAETAVQEAETQAEIATIELQSAQDALRAQEALNADLLAETILAIKREDAIRAAWQQVMLVRMAGLEERTALWNEAVERWAEEDLQFSTAMQARIQEVERLQALNAALEKSMADQRQLLVAQLEDLEQAEREAQENRTPETEPPSSSETGG